MQVRLQETDEVPGSTIQGANIFYANNAIDLKGLPANSPLVDRSQQHSEPTTLSPRPRTWATCWPPTAARSASAATSTNTTVAWYKFSVDLQGVSIDVSGIGSLWPTVFDVDYADGLSRPALTLWVFDSTGKLILTSSSTKWATDASWKPDPCRHGQPTVTSDASNVADDQANGNSANLSAGSYGLLDPFIGSVFLPEQGKTYYVAVTTPGQTADALNNPLLRREPMESVNRVVEDHITTTTTRAIRCRVAQRGSTIRPSHGADHQSGPSRQPRSPWAT